LGIRHLKKRERKASDALLEGNPGHNLQCLDGHPGSTLIERCLTAWTNTPSAQRLKGILQQRKKEKKTYVYGALPGHYSDGALRSAEVNEICLLELLNPRMQAS